MKNRRDFLKFLGGTAVLGAATSTGIIACSTQSSHSKKSSAKDLEPVKARAGKFKGIQPTSQDELVLAEGLSYYKLISWGEKINSNESFGFNNDFLCMIPDTGSLDQGLLWANHEYIHPLYVSGLKTGEVKTQAHVDKEMKDVGGSILRVEKKNDKWTFVKDHPKNKRLDATTKIPFHWDEAIQGSDHAIGTHSNCSGGITPWNTVLSAEENYHQFFGETTYSQDGSTQHIDSREGWEKFYPFPSEHYGWIVEVDLQTGDAQKLVSMGRYAHECCTMTRLSDGRVVAYSGDDKNDEFVYKFISSQPDSMVEGTLYVADTVNGKWMSMDWDSNDLLKSKFSSQTEVLIRAREAARLLGATPQDRPEDIEIDPITGDVVITMTNNKPKKNYHGHIMKISEKTGAYDSLEFKAETFVAGGEDTGFSCPDNLAFDKSGNLWFTSDISGSVMNVPGPYAAFKNNGLFVLIRHGEQAGQLLQLGSAPIDAELTGPWFSPDDKQLFLAVQHPGSGATDVNQPTSTWPHDGTNIPKPSVVVVEGPMLEAIVGLNPV